MTIEELTKKHLDEIQRFRLERLFNLAHGELSVDEAQLFDHMIIAGGYLKKGIPLPPTLLLELFIKSHASGHPQLSFVMDWLYRGAVEFHQAEGEEHFERGLGFTAGPGRRSGQGHEFKNARRLQLLGHERLYTWIRMLNVFDGYSVENATFIVHLLHERDRKGKSARDRKAMTLETLLTNYKKWAGKAAFNKTKKEYKEAWERNSPQWKILFEQLRKEGETIPPPSRHRRS
ncbi:MAG: hypothetical protein CVU71_06590 [Deltaproteobacteria bacterium HGW-Deltaproteobacteria-6]|jgi:hypothetical protein|nr:MAG: hypothetical protein CVU71_06590 [Deltaproteobacteria bacterium HGW-Deltaproteobacteria-6]